jgi:hypothetical protein
MLSFILVSCEEKPKEPSGDNFNIWVLNEGVWQMGNGSITAYNTSTNERESDIYSSANNGRQLGDTPNDIVLYGAKVYVVVSTSNRIDVLDSKTGVSIQQISVTTSSPKSEPRQAAYHNGKVYVCCFDGSVVKIDTASLAIEATVKAGRNPDGICVSNNKLYVSNSGGLDWETGNYDTTVSVFDLSTFTKIKDIPVKMNPGQMKADKNGNIYVVSIGNYVDVSPCLQRINTTTDVVENVFDIAITRFDIYDNQLYFYESDYFSGNTSYQVLDLLQNRITNTNFISGNTIQTPNGVSINPISGDIYIFDALDYTSTGDVYCFDRNGNKKFQFEAGVSPKKVVVR